MNWFFYAMIASGLCTIASLAQKKALDHENAIQVGSVSSIAIALTSLAFLPFVNFDMPLHVWILITVSGVVVGMAFYLWIKAFKCMNVSVASPLFNLGTIAAVILAVIFLNEKLTVNQLAGIVLLILGTYILELKHRNFFGPFKEIFKSEKVHIALFSSLGYSVVNVFNKYILDFTDPTTLMVLQMCIAAITVTTLTFIRHKGLKDLKKGISQHRMLILVIAISNVLLELSANKAFQLGEASIVLPVIRTWTLFVVILGGTYLKEGHLRNRIIATTLMLIGIMVVYI
jgi:drug/metabolite transporter (DMT)-like permease